MARKVCLAALLQQQYLGVVNQMDRFHVLYRATERQRIAIFGDRALQTIVNRLRAPQYALTNRFLTQLVHGNNGLVAIRNALGLTKDSKWAAATVYEALLGLLIETHSPITLSFLEQTLLAEISMEEQFPGRQAWKRKTATVEQAVRACGWAPQRVDPVKVLGVKLRAAGGSVKGLHFAFRKPEGPGRTVQLVAVQGDIIIATVSARGRPGAWIKMEAELLAHPLIGCLQADTAKF